MSYTLTFFCNPKLFCNLISVKPLQNFHFLGCFNVVTSKIVAVLDKANFFKPLINICLQIQNVRSVVLSLPKASNSFFGIKILFILKLKLCISASCTF